jgi:hypothetical protein
MYQEKLNQKVKTFYTADEIQKQESLTTYRGVTSYYTAEWGDSVIPCTDGSVDHYEVKKKYRLADLKHIQVDFWGFHGCIRPIAVFRYYNPPFSRFMRTKQSGTLASDPRDEVVSTPDSKIASSEIEFVQEYSLTDYVTEVIAFEKSNPQPHSGRSLLTPLGYPIQYSSDNNGVAGATFVSSAITIGAQSVARSAYTGGVAVCLRERSVACSEAAHSSVAVAAGRDSVAYVQGKNSAAVAVDSRSRAAAFDSHCLAAVCSAYDAGVAECRGLAGIAAGTGAGTRAVTTAGCSAAVITSSGTATCTGVRSLAAALGGGSFVSVKRGGIATAFCVASDQIENCPSWARAEEGGAILLAEFNNLGHLLHGEFRIVGECDDIKPNVFYTIKHGEILEYDGTLPDECALNAVRVPDIYTAGKDVEL